jgi:hypothetical protein
MPIKMVNGTRVERRRAGERYLRFTIRRTVYRDPARPRAKMVNCSTRIDPNTVICQLSLRLKGRPDGLRRCHFDSMVPGGLLVTPSTAVELRHLIGDPGRDLAGTSYGTRVQSAVIASSEETGRSTIGWP